MKNCYQSNCLLLLWLACWFFQSCQKDVVEGGTCLNFPPSRSFDGYTLVTAPNNWAQGVFNPNDNNQIIYTATHSDITSLYKTLLSFTNDTFLIFKGIVANPKWNKMGWVAFNDFHGNIYKIKDNGDSIAAFNIFTIANYYPEWRPDGKKIVFNGDDYKNKFGGLFLMNSDGSSEKSLDSIKGTISAWSPDSSKIAYSSDIPYLSYLDFFNGQKMVLKSLQVNEIINGIAWFPDSKWLIFSSSTGLFKLNTETKQCLLLRTSCECKFYGSPYVSYDGKSILVTRIDSKIIGHNTKYTESAIYLMNADGTNERKIDLK